jgi:hypothetical protein
LDRDGDELRFEEVCEGRVFLDPYVRRARGWTEKWSSPLKGSAGPLDVDVLGKEHRHDEGALDAK